MESTLHNPDGPDLVPLTHHEKKGTLLVRKPEVEAQIHQALLLSPDEQVVWALKDHGADFLENETLVYLIRFNSLEGRGETAQDMLEVLGRRINTCLQRDLYGFEKEDIEDWSHRILEYFCIVILAGDGRGDFLEVNFTAALKKKTYTAMARLREDRKEKQDNLVYLGDLAGSDPDESGANAANPDELIPDPDASHVIEMLHEHDDLQTALNALPTHLREVFLLRHYEGVPIESKFRGKITLSGIYQVTAKTIQSWLGQATQQLLKELGEDHESSN
jgi:DNA-directed RNA polymerase specialized sigma24 family protein